MIEDFKRFRADRDLLIRMELARLPVVNGRRYDLSAPGVRAAMERWKRETGRPVTMPLDDREREEFEYWLTGEILDKGKGP